MSDIWPKTITCKVRRYKEEKDSWVEIYFDPESPSPYEDFPVTVNLNPAQVRELIDKLQEAWPPARSHDYARGFASGKAHVQFPVCACEFADDEETLLSPCAAHAAWKEEL